MQAQLRPETRLQTEYVPQGKQPGVSAETEALFVALAENDAPQLVKQLDIKQLQKLLQVCEFIEPEEKNGNAVAQSVKAREAAARAISKIRRQLSDVVDNTSRTAIAELLASGLSLEKISLNVLSGVMAEIETNPMLETADESYAPTRAAELSDKYNVSPESRAAFEEYAKELAASGAPITMKNLLAMESADAMFGKLGNMTDAEIVSVLREDEPLTLAHAYTARYRVSASAEMPDADWQKLMPSVAQTFLREGIALSDTSLRDARLLLANGAGAAKENIQNADFLRYFSRYADREAALHEAAVQLAARKTATGFLLTDLAKQQTGMALDAENREVAATLQIINGTHIDIALSQVLSPSIGLLRNIASAGISANAPLNAPAANEAAQYKRQILTLQVKLTYESAARLAQKGFRVNTALPSEALAALEQLANDDAARTLRQTGAPDTDENVSSLNNVLDQIKTFRAMPLAAYAALRENRVRLTPAMVSRYAAADAYDLAAVPNAKFGDRFENVREQFAPLVESLGLAAEAENIRAAQILSRNNADVTAEGIMEIRAIDTQLHEVSSRLHPMLAAQLLKDGVNPSALTLDELLAHIERFEEKFGQTDAEKLTAHIAALDRQNTLSVTERDALLDVYRALHKAQRSDGAALGAAVLAGRTLTLENLSETADSFQRAGARFSAIDISLADGQSSHHASLHRDAVFIAKASVAAVIRHAAPAPLRALLHENGQTWPLDDSAAYLAEQAQSAEVRANAESSVLATLAEAGRVSAEAAAFLQSCGVPATLPNMAMFRRFMREPNTIVQLLDGETADILADAMPDDALAALRAGETPDALLSRMADKLAQAAEEQPTADYTETIRALRLRSAIAASTRSFHIPVKRNGKTTDVHMYVLNENADENNAELFVSLNTKLGHITARAAIADNVLNAYISVDHPRGAALLRKNTDALADAAQEIGCTLGTVEINIAPHVTDGGWLSLVPHVPNRAAASYQSAGGVGI